MQLFKIISVLKGLFYALKIAVVARIIKRTLIFFKMDFVVGWAFELVCAAPGGPEIYNIKFGFTVPYIFFKWLLCSWSKHYIFLYHLLCGEALGTLVLESHLLFSSTILSQKSNLQTHSEHHGKVFLIYVFLNYLSQ